MASGDFKPHERADLEASAATCGGRTRDPFDASLFWEGCPAKLAYQHPDVVDAVTLRGLSRLAPLADFPRGYAARVVDTWMMLDAEEAALRAEDQS